MGYPKTAFIPDSRRRRNLGALSKGRRGSNDSQGLFCPRGRHVVLRVYGATASPTSGVHSLAKALDRYAPRHAGGPKIQMANCLIVYNIKRPTSLGG